MKITKNERMQQDAVRNAWNAGHAAGVLDGKAELRDQLRKLLDVPSAQDLEARVEDVRYKGWKP